MKNFKTILAAMAFALICAMPLAAQFTTVTGTVIDPNGYPWSGATVTAAFNSPGGSTPQLNGKDFVPTNLPGTLASNGSFSLRVPDNSLITPGGSTWSFKICTANSTQAPAAGSGPLCFTTTTSVSGTTQDISNSMAPNVPALSPVRITNFLPGSNISFTLQNAANGTQPLFTTGIVPVLSNPGPGVYRITFYHVVTRAATTSSSTALTFTWQNSDGINQSFTTTTLTNTLGNFQSGSVLVDLNTNGTITWASSYASSGATSMLYTVKIRLEFVGP